MKGVVWNVLVIFSPTEINPFQNIDYSTHTQCVRNFTDVFLGYETFVRFDAACLPYSSWYTYYVLYVRVFTSVGGKVHTVI